VHVRVGHALAAMPQRRVTGPASASVRSSEAPNAHYAVVDSPDATMQIPPPFYFARAFIAGTDLDSLGAPVAGAPSVGPAQLPHHTVSKSVVWRGAWVRPMPSELSARPVLVLICFDCPEQADRYIFRTTITIVRMTITIDRGLV